MLQVLERLLRVLELEIAAVALARRLAGEMQDHYAELERRLDGDGDFALAAESVRKLMFLERLREEIGDAIERSDA